MKYHSKPSFLLPGSGPTPLVCGAISVRPLSRRRICDCGDGVRSEPSPVEVDGGSIRILLSVQQGHAPRYSRADRRTLPNDGKHGTFRHTGNTRPTVAHGKCLALPWQRMPGCLSKECGGKVRYLSILSRLAGEMGHRFDLGEY